MTIFINIIAIYSLIFVYMSFGMLFMYNEDRNDRINQMDNSIQGIAMMTFWPVKLILNWLHIINNTIKK